MLDFFNKKPSLDSASVVAPVTPPRPAPASNTAETAESADQKIMVPASDASLRSLDQVTEEQVEEIVKLVQSSVRQSMVELQLIDKSAALTESKLGGIPYLSKDGSAPADSLGRQLRLLAQIRLSELPPDSPLSTLSPEGMLQFWVLDDDIFGLGERIEDLVKNDTSRVIYYEKIDEHVTEQECAEKYSPWSEGETYFPFEGEFCIRFKKTCQAGISAHDSAFDSFFTAAWNKKYPQCQIASCYNLPSKAADVIFDLANGFGHKIGGYPGFTQEDPRGYSEELENHTILLLQIDSGEVGDREIMWGDGGVANFFITPEDLANKDFSQVLYTWDCF